MLISTAELENILADPNLVLIDTRSFREYSQGHIPNAINLDLFSFHWIDTSKNGIESFNEQARKIFSYAGVTEKKNVVFYDTVSGMLAARGVWILQYFSHTQASMLDGGITKWSNEGRITTTKPSNFKPTNFSGMPNPKILAGFQYILDNLNNLRKAIKISKRFYETEASGGVTLGNVRRIARTGVKRVSVGEITHSAPSVDFKLDFIS